MASAHKDLPADVVSPMTNAQIRKYKAPIQNPVCKASWCFGLNGKSLMLCGTVSDMNIAL